MAPSAECASTTGHSLVRCPFSVLSVLGASAPEPPEPPEVLQARPPICDPSPHVGCDRATAITAGVCLLDVRAEGHPSLCGVATTGRQPSPRSTQRRSALSQRRSGCRAGLRLLGTPPPNALRPHSARWGAGTVPLHVAAPCSASGPAHALGSAGARHLGHPPDRIFVVRNTRPLAVWRSPFSPPALPTSAGPQGTTLAWRG
ncbi:hypothetical protein NDU88_001559 [Pleurodeles waltl]|uniref:Uncharacterized protein n=1 Tax=Pleurodeles waltl TaxID=8319 RepID=A0AAV7TI64_PLEWA|nr:hypothetical protein NDU88_001559 [Pleurodeles waltl]